MSVATVICMLAVFALTDCARQDAQHVVHGFLYHNNDDSHVYYGSLDLNTSQFIVNVPLHIDDVGNPKYRKYSVLPTGYDPSNDLVFLAAPMNDSRSKLSVVNATSGVLLRTFEPMSNTIVSLQYDIFRHQLFANVETNTDRTTQIVEIDTDSGVVKRVLATINDAQPTDIASYCPICRKYFVMFKQDRQFVYIGVDVNDTGAISWRTPMDFNPTSIRFDYKTLNMYTAFINQTGSVTSAIGTVNRTSGSIGQVIGTISNDSALIVTGLSAFDVANKFYYVSTVSTSLFSSGISYVNVNTRTCTSIDIDFGKVEYAFYTFFVKTFANGRASASSNAFDC
jgi:hypothetical protein